MAATDWLIPLITLSSMEIVLGIDNIVFLAILVGRLPANQQRRARQIGLLLALGMRVLLLLSIKWIMGLTQPVFEMTSLGVPPQWLSQEVNEVSWRDLILLGGGLFLIAKSTYEIHDKLEGAAEKPSVRLASRFGLILVQIVIIDIVFSLDSVITAVGMAQDLWIQITAMVIAVGVMLIFAGRISGFVHRHPTMKILALSFLILIGVMLVAEGLGQHIDRGYIYFAMAFSLVVELINMKLLAQGRPVELREPPPIADGP